MPPEQKRGIHFPEFLKHKEPYHEDPGWGDGDMWWGAVEIVSGIFAAAGFAQYEPDRTALVGIGAAGLLLDGVRRIVRMTRGEWYFPTKKRRS